jgi:hypothetical protein
MDMTIVDVNEILPTRQRCRPLADTANSQQEEEERADFTPEVGHKVEREREQNRCVVSRPITSSTND